jgi:hypothetical protein
VKFCRGNYASLQTAFYRGITITSFCLNKCPCPRLHPKYPRELLRDTSPSYQLQLNPMSYSGKGHPPSRASSVLAASGLTSSGSMKLWVAPESTIPLVVLPLMRASICINDLSRGAGLREFRTWKLLNKGIQDLETTQDSTLGSLFFLPLIH